MDIFRTNHKSISQAQFGMHYFEDTEHYRELDLLSWLPELTGLGVNWITLLSEKARAIPEVFIKGVVQAGITTHVKFNFSFKDMPTLSEIAPLLQSYAAWGVKSVQFFDRPNEKSSWKAADWSNQDMIGKYLDNLLPFIRLANEYGLQTILPPLQPGGSYWDTLFLRSSLTGLMERGGQNLLDQMILSAYTWTANHNLNWGAGGAASWPTARPYLTAPDAEDQRGFRIFDWYNEISRSVTAMELPIVLYHCGIPADPYLPHPIQFNETDQISCNQQIYDLMHPESAQMESSGFTPLPSNILACNFWVLSANASHSWASQAWFNENGSPTTLGKAMKEKVAGSVSASKYWEPAAPRILKEKADPVTANKNGHPVKEYVLIPSYDWGVADFHLDAIRPYIKKHQPTIGFSLAEAKLAEKVILLGGEQTFPAESFQELRSAGCLVERISGDGTEIASLLAER
jgi:hypothetical protein